MSITYNTGIPAAGNNPADDQPLMAENTNAVNQWVGIDHVVFSNANAGKHNKSTYVAQTSVPTVVANELGLFAQASGGVTNLFYKHDVDATVYQLTNVGFVNTTAASGATYLPGGIILQWVRQTGNGPFSWAIPFPTAVFGATLGNNNATSGLVANLTSLTTSGATLNNSGGAIIFIMALGN